MQRNPTLFYICLNKTIQNSMLLVVAFNHVQYVSFVGGIEIGIARMLFKRCDSGQR